MATFGLIHGGGNGGWCWEFLVDELGKRGHAAVAVDMPIGDPTAGTERYARTLVDALTDVDDEVIIVGHSLGGLTAPVVATMRPVTMVVFLGGIVPTPGISFMEYLSEHPQVFDAERPPGSPPAPTPTDSGWINVRPWELAQQAQYHDCPPDLARRFWERLRPQSITPRTEMCPLETWPTVPFRYILMRDDRAVNTEWSRQIATERTGHDAIEIAGSHSPFLSRPAELAEVLVALDDLCHGIRPCRRRVSGWGGRVGG